MNSQSSAADQTESVPSTVLDLAERRWLPSYCGGDQQAFDKLVRCYGKLVYTFLYRYGVERQNRDDLFQEIFLKVHQAAARYRPSEPLRPWLISIVVNTVRNARRDSGRRQHLLTELQSESSIDAASAGHELPSAAAMEEQMDRDLTLQWLGQRITELAPNQREALVLSTLQGLSMKEIAKILVVPENTVKTHLRRARLALAKGLAQREGVAAGGGV